MSVVVATADDMRRLAARVARSCRAGDVILLSGDLGAGKTTFTQGLGRALGVVEPVTSPTFVIARVHHVADGPGLVHVDAYRLGSSVELDDLDLDVDTGDCVTVVEWGEGKAEGLSVDRLDVRIARGDDAEDETRVVSFVGHGPRWDDEALAALEPDGSA